MIKVGMNANKKGIMVLGMDDIGDYSQFASKEALRQELIDVYDSSTSRKNSGFDGMEFLRIPYQLMM